MKIIQKGTQDQKRKNMKEINDKCNLHLVCAGLSMTLVGEACHEGKGFEV